MNEGITKGSQLRARTYYLVDGDWIVYIESKRVKLDSAVARSWSHPQAYGADLNAVGQQYPLDHYSDWVHMQHPVPITKTQATVLINVWTN